MSCKDFFPPSDDARDEFSSLRQDDAVIRPYQPYCVTEVSSRSQSPVVSILHSLSTSRERNQSRNPQDRTTQQNHVNTVSISFMTTPEKHNQFALVEAGSKMDIQCPATNKTYLAGITKAADLHHITQAVTPRGSHLLATSDETMYDGTPSPTLQRIRAQSSDRSTSWSFQRQTSVLSSQRAVGKDTARLLSAVIDEPADSTKSEQLNKSDEDTEAVTKSTHSGVLCTGVFAVNGRISPILDCDVDGNAPSLPASEHRCLGTSSLREVSLAFENEITPKTLELSQTYPISTLQDSSQRLHSTGQQCCEAQFPSPETKHRLHGLHLGPQQGWAHRRTTPKDAKLKYQFGLRPPVSFELPSAPHLHRLTNQENTTNCTINIPSPFEPPCPYLEPQAGPRPPPWISMDTLDVQRRQRIDARDRADAALLRSKKSSTSSLYPSPGPRDSFSMDAIRKELEEYREQVLRVYPDMQLDRGAEKGGILCCCTIM